VNTRRQGNFTPLIDAARSHEVSRTALMEYLLSVGADVHAKRDYGRTSLDLAPTEKKEQLLREWMSKG